MLLIVLMTIFSSQAEPLSGADLLGFCKAFHSDLQLPEASECEAIDSWDQLMTAGEQRCGAGCRQRTKNPGYNHPQCMKQCAANADKKRPQIELLAKGYAAGKTNCPVTGKSNLKSDNPVVQ